MSSRRPEVADIIRTFEPAYREAYSVSFAQERVLCQLPLCRTASLGGHMLRCDSCGHEEISYNSCRNRHCPKCRAAARAEWLEARESEILDVPYFHVVFTLPGELGAIALQNKRLCYSLLFRASAETLRTIAADPKHLGAQIGFLAVLHTWTQTLLHHPHVHCVVPGGGISPDEDSWIACREGFFLPVRVLSRLFRRLYVKGLERAWRQGDLEFHGRLKHLRDPAEWARTMAKVRRKEWVVHAKPPFGGPVQVLKYLARYTHRVAISNSRILGVDGDRVRFSWKDRSDSNRSRVVTVTGVEFVRRFLLHVFPKGFVSIRYFGFLSNRSRAEKISIARQLLEAESSRDEPDTPRQAHRPDETPIDQRPCPKCDTGHMTIIAEIEPLLPAILDSS